MSKNHFVSHFLPFQINTTILIFVTFFLQNDCRRPFWMSENHFRSHFWPFQINTKLYFFLFYKMVTGAHFGCPKFTFDRISGHFRSIRNFIYFLFFFTKWLLAATLNIQKLLSVAFLAISGQYKTFLNFVLQNSCRRPFWMSEIHFGSHFWPF